MHVIAREAITPHLVSITLGGPELDGLDPGLPAASVRLLVPQDGELVLPTWNGNEYRYDGWKSMGLNIRRSWTTCRGKIYDADGEVWADGTLYFSFRRHFPALLASFRFLWPWRRSDRVREPQPALDV